MAQNLNRPNSGISTDSKNTGSTGGETQSANSPVGGHQAHSATSYLQDPNDHGDGVLDIAQNSSSAAGGIEEGSIRQDQSGYAGS
jgi:hypothetical protein